ncbi:MAG: TauD/TfdA family dioxygenase [OM182 bacterium]|nr:MAG: TauD/TfdA family dioxygenase [OM182 bacterium]|tara:strand:+ start:154 stop:1017 length:864 start_codon:yes stop_codon:yes gene_type:complete
MTVSISPHANDFGAAITGVDLSQALDEATRSAIRQAWLQHQVVYFPDQPMSYAQLEQFSLSVGPFGNDPYVQAIDGHEHIVEVRREPDEDVPLFGGTWHSDWSFQAEPPNATLLHAKIIPPVGGGTHYADGVRAFEHLDPGLARDAESLQAVHSARKPYSPEGVKAGGGDRRSMTLLPSETALLTQRHPLVRTHPETGRRALWVNPLYTIGIEGLGEDEAMELLNRLFDHMRQSDFIYQHTWQPNMLTMWDNRSVMHSAQGGYGGHRRVLHRLTVAGTAPFLRKLAV